MEHPDGRKYRRLKLFTEHFTGLLWLTLKDYAHAFWNPKPEKVLVQVSMETEKKHG
jgi:hypothetical protein